MLKRSSKQDEDINRIAKRIVGEAIEEPTEKEPRRRSPRKAWGFKRWQSQSREIISQKTGNFSGRALLAKRVGE